MRKTGMDTKNSLCDMIFLKKRVLVDINVAEKESKGELTFHFDECHMVSLRVGSNFLDLEIICSTSTELCDRLQYTRIIHQRCNRLPMASLDANTLTKKTRGPK